jgi:lipopolysaccharide transport system ATP-binding protein
MQLRLAFAVAAFLEPEILVVDEVLAVGDAEFQRKCLGKMEDVSRSGRTILFVSHNMSAIQTLCRRAVLLEGGRVKTWSRDVRAVVASYLTGDKATIGAWWTRDSARFDNPYFAPRAFGIVDAMRRAVTSVLDPTAEYWVSIEADVAELHPALTIGYALYAEDGTLLYWSYHTDAGDGRVTSLRSGRNLLRSRLPGTILNEGVYRLEVIGGLHFIQWLFEPNTDVPQVYVELTGTQSQSPYWLGRRPGLLAPSILWTNESVVS